MRLTCGIALCTYNGQKFLEEQLASIVAQRRLPDSIVICDDCSSDQTWEILQAFEAASPMPVKLVRHTVQQGVVRNFETAVRLLETDIVFLCDQDDLWLPEKISTTAALFESDPEANLIFTDAVLVDEQAQELGELLFSELQITRQEEWGLSHGRAFEVLCRRNVITGATTAFRRSLLDAALPFPAFYWHDEWLGLIAAATGKVVKLPDPTIKYRQHGKNLVGVKKLTSIESLKRLRWSMNESRSRHFATDRVDCRTALAKRLELLPAIPADVDHRCQKAVAFAQARANLPRRFLLRLPAVLWMAVKGEYRQFEELWKSHVFRDLLYK